MTISVDSKAARERLRACRDAIANGAQRVTENVIAATARMAQSTRAFKDVTGDLRRSIKGTTGTLGGFVTAGSSHAGYVEYGNAPRGGDGFIYPKSGKFLKFAIAGRTVFAKRVRATQARPYMQPARDAAIDLMATGILNITDTAIRRHNGG